MAASFKGSGFAHLAFAAALIGGALLAPSAGGRAPARAASLALLAPSAGGRASARAASLATHLQVTQVEYRLGLSSAVVKAGRVSLAQIDRGHEQHDLRLRGPHGELKGKLLRPGTRWEGVVVLAPGTYQLWCSLPEHAKRGMHTTLRVVR